MSIARSLRGLLLSLVAVTGCGCGDNLTPAALVLEPEALTLQVGENGRITARRGEFDVTAVSWSSSDGTVARVTPGNNGTAAVRGLAAGDVVITAMFDGATATAAVTVTAATLERLAISPPTPSLAGGTTTMLTAIGTYSDGTTADLTGTVTWTSAAPSVATVDATGQLAGASVGTAVITVTLGSISATTTAMVTAAS